MDRLSSANSIKFNYSYSQHGLANIPRNTEDFCKSVYGFTKGDSNVSLSSIEEALKQDSKKHEPGIDLNARILDADGRVIVLPPLSIVLEEDFKDREALVAILLKYGADPNMSIRGSTSRQKGENSNLLCDAIQQEDTSMVRLLLEANANPNLTNGEQDPEVPLKCAERVGNQDIIDLLKQHGAVSGETPLFSAVENGNVAEGKCLIEQGVDINHVAPDGTTALYVARKKNNPEFVAMLEGYGAKLNEKEVDKLNRQLRILLHEFLLSYKRDREGALDKFVLIKQLL